MKSKVKRTLLILGTLLVCVCFGGGAAIYASGRPAPIPFSRKLFDDVQYRREVRFIPRPMIAHIVTIDLRSSKIRFFVTPGDTDAKAPLAAQTTSQFLARYGAQIAINGDGFYPWWSNSIADYYPHVGDLVSPNGTASSDGEVYTRVDDRPTLFISRRNTLSISTSPPSHMYNAISGDRLLVTKGELESGLDDESPAPRTSVGINKSGNKLIIVVVDGRQPYYSEGATFVELARLLIDNGAYIALNLDGGGSSTLVVQGANGKPEVLNSPIDSYIPGRERPVGNHLGIYVKQ
jgi:hypothetical protein